MRNGIDFKLGGSSSSKLVGKNNLMAVIDLAEVKKFDKEDLLPSKGYLAFYYDLSSNSTGRGFMADRKYYSVTYSEDFKKLKGEGFTISSSETYPDSDDLEMLGKPAEGTNPHDFHLRMLGWPRINDNVTLLLELNRRHFDLSKGLSQIAPHVIRRSKLETENWILLLELDSNFLLEFGDGGILYYYIRKEDLEARSFDKVWMIREDC